MDGKTFVLGITIVIILGLVALLALGIVDVDQLMGGEDTGPTLAKNPNLLGNGKTPGGAKDITKQPQDLGNQQCKDACDDSCKDEMDDCEDDCDEDYEDVCEQASEVLAGCNFGCQFIPIPPGPGPNPRADCFNQCANAFNQQCDSDDLKDCEEDCSDDYLLCIADCYADC